MRTTIAVDDGLLEQLRAFAKVNGLSLRRAANEIIRRGLQPSARHLNFVNGLAVVPKRAGDLTIRIETILRVLD